MLLAFCALAPTKSQSQTRCFPTEQVFAKLQAEYHESVRYRGVAHDGNLILLLASDNRTWTLLALPAQSGGRLSCFMWGGTGIDDAGTVITVTNEGRNAEIRIAHDRTWQIIFENQIVVSGDDWEALSPIKPVGFRI